MSHVTRTNESCPTWMSHVTHMNESCQANKWVMSHIWMSHVTHMDESCRTYAWVMSHILSHSYAWHDSFMCVTWLIHVGHDSFVRVTWLIYMGSDVRLDDVDVWNMMHLYVWLEFIYMFDLTHLSALGVCLSLSSSSVWRDSLVCVTHIIHKSYSIRRIHSCDLTYTYVWTRMNVFIRRIHSSHKNCLVYVTHSFLNHGTHMNESWHTHEWVMAHTWMSHGTHMNESCHTYEWVTYTKQSSHKNE